MPYAVLSADTNLTTTPTAMLNITFGASQIAEIDSCLTFTLPANHGGLQLNWRMPAAWPFYAIVQKWSWSTIGTDESDTFIDGQPVASATNADWVQILAPGPAAAVIRVKAIHTFKAPAGGGVMSLYASMIASAASPTVMNTNPATHLASYAWYELQ